MKKHRLQFSININAEKSKIWKALWSDSSYREWARVFYEGSYVVADSWDEGSTVMFLAPDQSGIYSIIESHIPNQIIRFKHIGKVTNGEQQPIDDETKIWTGATEQYRLSDGEDCIKLTVDIDVMDEHLEFMTKTLPKALDKMKHLSVKH